MTFSYSITVTNSENGDITDLLIIIKGTLISAENCESSPHQFIQTISSKEEEERERVLTEELEAREEDNSSGGPKNQGGERNDLSFDDARPRERKEQRQRSLRRHHPGQDHPLQRHRRSIERCERRRRERGGGGGWWQLRNFEDFDSFVRFFVAKRSRADSEEMG